MKKSFVTLLILSFVLNMLLFPKVASADSDLLCEIYSFNFLNHNTCAIKGKLFQKSDTAVSLYTIEKSAGSSTRQSIEVKPMDDGSFYIVFEFEPKAYTICITAGGTDIFRSDIDLSDVPMLFNSSAGYSVESIVCSNSGIKLCGRQSGKTDGWVNLMVIRKGQNLQLPESICVLEQTRSTGGDFEFEFALESGEYTAYIMGEDLNQHQQDFTVSGLCDFFAPYFSEIDESNFSELNDKLSSYKDELDELIEQCHSRGLSTDYEMLNYSLINKFLSYMKDEAEHNDYTRMSRYNDVLSELYFEAKANMLAYLSGEKEPLAVPKYVTSEVTTDGTSVRATTVDGATEREAPVFFVGYGHWETVREDIPFFQSIGSNIVQMQMDGPVVVEGGSGATARNEAEEIAAENGWGIDYAAIDRLKADLGRAEDNNILVSLNIGADIPAFILDADPSIKDGGTPFLPYNVNHPTARKAIEARLRAILPQIKDYKSLYDICLTNEPAVTTNKSTYYIPQWQEYIRNIYGTIENLNSVYGSSYQSFDEVLMPDEFSRTPLFYDWRNFNDSVFAEFHQWLAQIVKEEAPELKVQCKVMDYFDHYYYEDLVIGSDYERIADYMDLNGCDAFAYYDIWQQPLLLKMGWYDFMTSVKDVPVWNTEDHLIRDLYTIDYNNIIAPHISADIWNGAVHGRGASVIWIWDKRDESMPWGADSGYVGNYQSSNFVLRPKEVAEIGKTALDLNRLADEVTAIQKEEPQIGLLYSRTSLGYNEEGMDTVAKAYESILYNGQKVGFVTDSRPEDMHKYKALVIPGATNISTEVLDNIETYVDNGGKIFIIDQMSLGKDEHNREHDVERIHKLYTKATVIDANSLETELAEQFNNMGISRVILVDAETGEKVSGTEWSYAEIDGEVVVNILNYDIGKEKIVKIIYDGNNVEKFRELRSGEECEKIIKLEPYIPVIVEF